MSLPSTTSAGRPEPLRSVVHASSSSQNGDASAAVPRLPPVASASFAASSSATPAPARRLPTVVDPTVMAGPGWTLEHALRGHLQDSHSKQQEHLLRAARAARSTAREPTRRRPPQQQQHQQPTDASSSALFIPVAPLEYRPSNVLFTPRALPSSLTAASPVASYYVRALASDHHRTSTEQQDFVATCERQLAEAQLLSGGSGSEQVTPARLAVVCDLLDAVAAHSGPRHAGLLRRLVRQLFCAAFQGFSPADMPLGQRNPGAPGGDTIGDDDASVDQLLAHDPLTDPETGLQRVMAALGSWHPLSPLVDSSSSPSSASMAAARSSGGGAGGGGTSLGGADGTSALAAAAVPATFTVPEPPAHLHFRHALWELQRATWQDLLRKQTEAQEQLREHRRRVAAELGMELTDEGQLVARGNSSVETKGVETSSSSSRPVGMVPSVFSAALHSASAGATSSGGGASQSVGMSLSNSSSTGSTSTSSSGRPPAATSSSLSLSPRTSPSNFLLSARPQSREAQRQAIIDSAKGAAVAEAEAVAARSTTHFARPPNLSLRLDSRAGVGGVSGFSAPPTPSPRAAPLTAASMSACDTAHMGAMLSEALALSSAEGGGSVSIGAGGSSAMASFPAAPSGFSSVKHASSHRSGMVEEKEQVFTFSRTIKGVAVSATDSSNDSDAVVAQPPPPRPRSAERTQAVTAAAFATISNLVSTPSVPSECTLAYFDVMRRLDMQHANLHQRIRAWAQKQADLQAQSGGRDQVLTRIARHMRSTLLAQMFLRWVEVVVQRKRQQVAWSSLHRRYADSDAHLKARFLSWRIYTLRRRAALTDRVVRDTDARNMVLQSELGELRTIRGREADKRDLLRSKEAALVKERDEIANFLDQCQAQIRSVQGAQITQLISRTIRVLEESIGTLWSELKAAREANLQDPCRMLVSSTVLLEHVSKPYSQMVECSSEWVSARRAEVARSRARFDAMLDADLLLTWVNFHAAEAHLKLNQDKLSAKFYGKNYKYDVPGAYPTHVRNFYSSEASLQRRAENFTSSLQDCEVLLRLLTQISPHLADVDVLAHVDLEVRGRKTFKLLGLLSPEAASLLSPLDLTHCFAPDLCAALLCRIMMNYPCLGKDNTAFGGDPRRKPKSEYANNNDANSKNSAAAAAQAAQVNKLKAQGLSAQGASRAAALMAEEARIEGRDIASLDLSSASSNVLPTAASLGLERADTYLAHRDESEVVAQQRERRRSISTSASTLADAAAIVPPLAAELDEADAERSVKDCGPFTQLLRALHLVKRELTTRARVEVNLVSHVTASVRKVLTDVRILLDDAYERDALWQSVRRRVAAFSTTILTCQMRGTPLAMPDRQALRQIRRFTKLLDRTGKPQERFMDLLHPWNRTSNDVLMRRTRARKGKAKGGANSSESDEEEDDETKAAKRALRKANKAHKGGEDDDDSSSSSSSSSDSDSDNDSDDDDEEEHGARTAEGDDLWREHKLLTPSYLSSLSGEESERLLRRARHRGETLEDLQSQATFELAKMQEQLAKHYQSLRDVFRAYAQVAGDSTVEQAFRAREEEKGGGTGAGSATGGASGTGTSGLGSTGLSSPGGSTSGAGGTPSGKTGKKERAEVDEDPTASLRRKLRDALAGNSSSSYGSSGAGGLAASLGGLSSSSSSSSSASAAAEAHQAALAHNVPANPQLRYHDFLLFVRDCHILTPHFGVKKVARIFEKVWTRDMRAAMSAAGAGASSDHPLHAHAPPLLQSMRDRARMEIDCRQFVEVLIRIAHQRMPGPREREELLAELECDREAEAERKRAEGGGGPASGATTAGPNGPTDVAEHAARQMDALTRASISVGQTGPSNAITTAAGASAASNPAFEFGTPLFPSTRLGLALRLFGLVRCKIMPSAARLSIDAFRAQYKRIEVSVLYKKHGAVLRKLFHRYAKIHAVRGKAHVQVAAAAAAAAQAQAASAAAAASVDGADSATISAAEDAVAAAAIAAGAAASAASEAVWTNAIDAKELVQLLRDSKILDGRVLTLSQLYAICANVQTDLAKVPALPQLPQDEKKEGAGSGLQQSAREIRAEAAAKARTINAARRRSGQKKLELPGLAATAAASSTSAVASSSVSAAASNTVSPDVSQGPSLAASRRASLQTGGEWGSGSSSRNAAAAGLSLQDLNLEAQAAAASAAPSDEQILSQHSSASGGGGHTALLFAEFLEALAAVAAVKHPFPYRPLHVRLQHFLERDLLPWIQITQANNKE